MLSKAFLLGILRLESAMLVDLVQSLHGQARLPFFYNYQARSPSASEGILTHYSRARESISCRSCTNSPRAGLPSQTFDLHGYHSRSANASEDILVQYS